MSESVINAAVADFIAEIIVKHGSEPKKVYCDKDPFNLRNFLKSNPIDCSVDYDA